MRLLRYFVLSIFCFLSHSAFKAQSLHIDDSFGDKGFKIFPDIYDGMSVFPLINSDNSFIISGSYDDGTLAKSRLYKFDDSGDPDLDFGTNGIVENLEILENANISFIKKQSDNRIIIGGTKYPEEKVFLSRFFENGSMDNTFGSNGVIDLPLNYAAEAFDAYIPETDEILVAGGQFKSGLPDGFICKIKKDGKLDMEFGVNGIADIDFVNFSFLSKIFVSGNGKILVTGEGGKSISNFFAARFFPDGKPDTDYGDSGYVTLNFETGLPSHSFSSLLQEDGKLLLIGYSGDDFFKTALARLNDNGSLDSTFNEDGKFLSEIGNSFSYPRHAGKLKNGNYIISGTAAFRQVDNLPNWDYFLMSLDDSGKIDNNFCDNGFYVVHMPLLSDDPVGMMLNGETIYLNGLNYGLNNEKYSSIVKLKFEANSSIQTTSRGYFKLGPNPFSTFIQIVSEKNVFSTVINIEIVDILGNTVKLLTIDHGPLPVINSDYLPAGTYFIKISTGNFTGVHKLIKI